MVGCSSYDFDCWIANIKHFAICCPLGNPTDAIRYHFCLLVSYAQQQWDKIVKYIQIFVCKLITQLLLFFFSVAVPAWWHHSFIITFWHWDIHHVVIHTIVTCSMNCVWPQNHLPTDHKFHHSARNYYSQPSISFRNWPHQLHRPNINVIEQNIDLCVFSPFYFLFFPFLYLNSKSKQLYFIRMV